MTNSLSERKTENVERKTFRILAFCVWRLHALVWAGGALLALSACGVHQTETPGLTGPSELALSLRITATPDSISQDGGSQSSIQIVAQDANAKPIVGLSVRVDIRVGGTFVDFGTLSARTVVTGSDGKANLVYTAPPPPPANSTFQATCGTFATTGELDGQCVAITAAPMGTNFSTAQSQFVEIRLVPPGVILPPAGTPTPKFTVSPTSPAANLPVQFDASTELPDRILVHNAGWHRQLRVEFWRWIVAGFGSGRQPHLHDRGLVQRHADDDQRPRHLGVNDGGDLGGRRRPADAGVQLLADDAPCRRHGVLQRIGVSRWHGTHDHVIPLDLR